MFYSSRRLQRFTLNAEGDWLLYFDAGSGLSATLVSAWILADCLVALSWRVDQSRSLGSSVNIWLFRSQIRPDAYRRLVVRLRFPAKSHLRGAA